MRGPGWITSARIISHLIDEGRTADDAERLLSAIPAWALIRRIPSSLSGDDGDRPLAGAD